MRASISKIIVAGLLVSAGVLGGLVLSGRMSMTSPGVAAPQPRPAVTPPTIAGLPDLSSIAERAIRASVNISSTQTYRQRNDPWMAYLFGGDPGGYTERQAQSLGSGVVVSADGFVVTNNHVVVDTSSKVKVTLADNREFPATIVGVDEITDLAVLKITATGLEPLPWADSSKLRVAEWVLAIGNPFAFNQTVTLGIVSAVNRHNPQLATYNDMIQTDAAINPGNSGGALINSRGELVGINTMIYSETGGYQGIGFAIPSNLAQKIIEALKKDGEVVHGSIGLYSTQTVDPDRAESAGLGRIRGVFITDMYRNGSAVRAGIRPEDIIVRVNDTDITDQNQLDRMIVDAAVGSTMKIEVLRAGRRMTFNVVVEKMQPQRVRRGR
jgi:serine protease Do